MDGILFARIPLLRSFSKPVLVSLPLWLSMCTTACRTPSQDPSPNGASLFPLVASDEEDFDAAHPPAVSLTRAIEIAQGHAEQREFVHAELWPQAGKTMCLAAFLDGEGLCVLQIDAESEAVVGKGDAILDSESLATVRSLRSRYTSSISVARAIAIAAGEFPGSWPIRIGRPRDATIFEIWVVGEGGERAVRVSAIDGAVLPSDADSN